MTLISLDDAVAIDLGTIIQKPLYYGLRVGEFHYLRTFQVQS